MNSIGRRLGLGVAQMPLEPVSQAHGRSANAEMVQMLSIAARTEIACLDLCGINPTAMDQFRMLPMPVAAAGFRLTLSAGRADRGPDQLETNLLQTIEKFGIDRVHAVVVNSAGELNSEQGRASWRRLQEMRNRGQIEKLGLSLFASDDCVGLVERFGPDLVQVPGGLLDQRLMVDGTLASIIALGVEVQLRSLFLNGLLFLPPHQVNQLGGFAATQLSRVRRMIAEGRSDPLQAAIGFALSRDDVSKVLINPSSVAELSAVIAAANNPPPELDWKAMALADAALLDSAAA